MLHFRVKKKNDYIWLRKVPLLDEVLVKKVRLDQGDSMFYKPSTVNDENDILSILYSIKIITGFL